MLTERWKIQLLGGLIACRGEQIVDRFRTRKGGEILAALALNSKVALPREELLALLWPDEEAETSRNRLRVELVTLRRQFQVQGQTLTSPIEADRFTVRLHPEAFSVDTVEFEHLLAQASRATERGEQIQQLAQAADLYRGDLVPGWDAAWIVGERERLAALHQEALRRLIRRLAHERDFDRAIGYAHRALQTDAWNEEAHFDLVRLLVAVGQPSAAIRQYETLEQMLREEFAAKPTATMQEFIRQLRERSGPGTPRVGAAVQVPAPVTTPLPSPPVAAISAGLPVRLTRFFGREQEMEACTALLKANRLVTVTGPGGTGKTRLMIETAATLDTLFAGGVHFVYLGNLLDAGHLPESLRQTLRLPARTDIAPLDQVIERLSQAPALLILDNFEHLVEAGAALVQTLLETIPALTLAVTSRRVLGIVGEQEFPLSPLPTPVGEPTPEALSDYASVRLFLDRAQAVRPDFQLTPRNASAIAALCRYLEGIPLALELAAARIRTLTPLQMTERLVPRLELLVNPRADKDSRHRSLRTTIAWSVQMLSPHARRLFAQLAVFQGGWDAEGAAQVCLSREASNDPAGDPGATPLWSVFDLLERLLSESLLVAEERNGSMRFRMLDTLREFAWEQLPPPEQERLRRRHAAYWMQFGEEIGPKLQGPQLKESLDRLEEERANLTAALIWCTEPSQPDLSPSPAEIGLRIMGALWRFWEIRGNIQEGRQFTERLLALAGPEINAAVLARAHSTITVLAKSASDFVGALTHCEWALAHWRQAGNLDGVAATLGNKGNLLNDLGRFSEAQACYEEGLTVAGELGIPWRIAAFHNSLGSLQRVMGDLDAAQANLETALVLRKQIGDRRAIYSTLGNLATLAHNRGDFAAAVQGQLEALGIVRELEDRFATAVCLINLGNAYDSLHDHAASYACYCESLQLHTAVGSHLGQAYALCGLAAHAAALNFPERAGTLQGAADALMQAIQVVMPPIERQSHERAFTHIAADPRFLNALETGRTLPLEAAISLALQPL